MIITKEIIIDINKGNLPYYSKDNKEIKIGDKISIEITKLSIGSNQVIEAKCDICGNEVNIKYILYNRSTKGVKKFACSKKCSSKRQSEILLQEHGVKNISQLPSIKSKIKETNIEKYGSEYYFGSNEGKESVKLGMIRIHGVDNPQKSLSIRNKSKISNIEKYGVEYTLQNNDIREKIKETNLIKYGNEVASKSIIVKDKIKETNNKKFGGNSPLSNLDVNKKSKETLFKNYGVSSPLKSQIIKDRVKETNLLRYGVEYPTQNSQVLDRIKENNIIKWGKPHPYQNDEFISSLIIGSNPYYLKYLSDGISMFKCDLGLEHNFEMNADNFYSRIKNCTNLCTICHPIGEQTSISEKEVLIFIESIYNAKVINGYRDVYEIDIYLPDINLGFEFNGLYWHSDKFKDKWYHINKTNHFKERGISIFHIWSDDWRYKKDIIKSMILNRLGLNSNKIYARKCIIKVVSSKETLDFYNKNHIQGFVRGKVSIGLYIGEDLVSLMSFDQFEGRRKMNINDWNLSRFCNLLNTNVIGGASKLLNYFILNFNPQRIISYADISWSSGNLYEKLGFDLVSISNPDYKYILDGRKYHKSRFTKSKLKLSTNETETSYMKRISEKIWDCGKIKFEKIL